MRSEVSPVRTRSVNAATLCTVSPVTGRDRRSNCLPTWPLAVMMMSITRWSLSLTRSMWRTASAELKGAKTIAVVCVSLDSSTDASWKRPSISRVCAANSRSMASASRPEGRGCSIRLST